MSWVGSLLAGLFEALVGWWFKRRDAAKATAAANHQAQAEAHESEVRDDTARKVATDREKNDALLDRACDDAGAPGGLRKQSADIAAAISEADSEVR